MTSHLSHAVFEERMRKADETLVDVLLEHLEDDSALKRCVALWKSARADRSSLCLEELCRLLEQLK